MTGDPGDGRYPSAAAQAVFVRLVPPAAVGVALKEAEDGVTQRAALPLRGSWATSFLGPKLPTHVIKSTRLPARGTWRSDAGPRLN